MKLRWILPVCLSCACAAPVDPVDPDDPASADDGAPVTIALPVPDELAACLAPEGAEPVGEACDEYSSLCGFVCTSLATIGCTTLLALAGEGTVLTLGTLAIPAGTAAAAACAAIVGGGIAGCLTQLGGLCE